MSLAIKITPIIAIWGATTGTLALVINYLSFRRDRADVFIEILQNMQLAGQHVYPYKKGKNYISFKVGNKGRRPFTIEKVGYVFLKKDGGVILGDSIMKGAEELTEGKFANYLLSQDDVDFSEINYFAVYDAVGNTYKKYVARPHKRFFYWLLYASCIKKKASVRQKR